MGAGAAGLFFAAKAGEQGKRVLVLDHAKRLCEKIRISGGGRCNFTNLGCEPKHFLSENPKFAISALRGYRAHDFLAEVEAAGIPWEEKKLGQLFCQRSAQDIIDLLLDGCCRAGVIVKSGATIGEVGHDGGAFTVTAEGQRLTAPALVIATGGKSIPKIGATGFGYEVARQFGLPVIEPRPALVPLTFGGPIREMAKELAGLSIDASVAAAAPPGTKKKAKPPAFEDGFLFTHRGLSGPSVLQASSYWREGQALEIDLAPARDMAATLRERKARGGAVTMPVALAEHLPKRLAQKLAEHHGWQGRLADWPDRRIEEAADKLHRWQPLPDGSEGYRTAEVTAGGVDTAALHSKTMEAKSLPGLYFVGEVVDVTGWLGGYNFQWAWASAVAAAKALAPSV
ncbi:NAD(P)/FAD-dependent oxidoreductase [Parvularcula sp. BGMRC 0090]|uniref:NAD(P)/FAD-dependent oxidoreductase n=1 Tax=Parvularcula maris TaxID=2965077 RepID=A0A9X2RHH2_9PROT|nr:NAD(P)/FAD-dependent oxidoreductase [Parvularcula maris]